MNGAPVPVVQRDLLTSQVGLVASRVGLPGCGLVLGLLAALHATDGLGPAGWAVGLTSSVLGNLWLVAAMIVHGRTRLGPADLVTLTRAALACGGAALVADSFSRPAQVTTLVWLAAVALALDWVDGRVARRTGTVTPLGARFDMEVDSFLILVLSVHVAREQGLWVLAIGLASYALLAAKRVLPWLRRPMPPRYWCKVVAAIQGVVLTVATAAVLPHTVMAALLVLALALLVESFGREVIWLSRMRYDDQLASEPTISRAA
jgi:phosphatidylglycerophosphate synthase